MINSNDLQMDSKIQERTKKLSNIIFSISKKNGKWTAEEDQALSQLVEIHGNRNWKKIANLLGTRNAVQCLHRWTKILQPGLIKGPWTVQEDRKLIEWVKTEGPKKWSLCSEMIQGRSGKQCRERWFNTLNPSVKKGNWTAMEDYQIFKLFSVYGSKWSKISEHFKGRTENSIKNRFYSTLRRIAAKGSKTNYEQPSQQNGNLEDLLRYVPEAFKEKEENVKIEGLSDGGGQLHAQPNDGAIQHFSELMNSESHQKKIEPQIIGIPESESERNLKFKNEIQSTMGISQSPNYFLSKTGVNDQENPSQFTENSAFNKSNLLNQLTFILSNCNSSSFPYFDDTSLDRLMQLPPQMGMNNRNNMGMNSLFANLKDMQKQMETQMGMNEMYQNLNLRCCTPEPAVYYCNKTDK